MIWPSTSCQPIPSSIKKLLMATAEASITQTRSEIEAQRALLFFTPRVPNSGEIFNQQLGLPFSFGNDGKSPASEVDLHYKAVLLRKTDKLSFDEKNLSGITARYLSAGIEYPIKSPAGDQHHPLPPNVIVRDTKGRIIPIADQAAQDFLSGADNGATAVFIFGHMKYSDFAGTHTVRFCSDLWVLNNGATRGASTPNEKACARYSSQKDEYAQYPNVAILPSTPPPPSKQIDCVAPK
jgi:hypothetical protein